MNAGLFLVSDSGNSCVCSVFITDCFICFNCRVNKHCYLLHPWAYWLQDLLIIIYEI